MIKVGHQGTFGSFSYIAAKELYNNAEIVSYKTFIDVADAVCRDEIDYGVIPLENSYAGRVTDVYQMFKKTTLYIIAEKLLKINHCLSAKSNIDLSMVTHIHSHEQALKQCEQTIKKLMPNAILVPEKNTAFAAELIAKIDDTKHVAICSKLATQNFDLHILKENIQDINDNYTLFIVFSKKQIDIPQTSQKVLTSMLFEINNTAGSLFNCLNCFAQKAINLIKIESYIPNVVLSQNASFFITIEGNLSNHNLQDALNDLKQFANNIHIFGSYLENRNL